MSRPLLTLEIHFDQDVVQVRQRTRELAQLLGFDSQDQVRLATAVSEIARNALQYAHGGQVQYWVDLPDQSPTLYVQIQDQGPGIVNLEQILTGQDSGGLGIVSTQRLMEQFEIHSSANGTVVVMGKPLPSRHPPLTADQLHHISQELAQRSPRTALEEVQQQNQELLQALAVLRQREEELLQLNRELEDTNRGVVALYAELDEKAESLKRASELKTRFLSNMSHEFRTPLNSILSLSQILLDRLDGELSPEQDKQVQFIHRSAEGLSELVNDLLDLAKVEAGKIVVHPNEFEVPALFGTLRGMLRPLLTSNRSIALVFEDPTDLPPLWTDEGKVAQILRNFISNALKYTEQGEVRVTAVRQGDQVVFAVADTGIGIAPADQERIFEDFIQIESVLQQRFKGTGLGLPLSRKLAELLGGSVAVTSVPGQGATFSATIPLHFAGSPDIQVEEPPLPALDPTRLPLLVLEDEVEALLTYERFFAHSCYQLVATRTLKQFRQIITDIAPLAVLLDIRVGQEHSWGLLSELKSNPLTRSIPVVVVSVVDNEAQALRLGASAFFLKPVDRLTLFNCINRLVWGDRTAPKLLLIDDDPTARYLIKQQLTDMSHLQLLEASSGSEAMALAEVEQPQAIVLDLAMPEMDGFAVLQHLKANPLTATIPIIINTSQPLDVVEHNLLTQHSVAVLSKNPLTPAGAIAQLREALLRAGLALNA